MVLGPFHQAVSSVMTLTNPSDRKVCFKIKTTAPKRYCVKPNSGVIDPKQTVQIAGSFTSIYRKILMPSAKGHVPLTEIYKIK